MSHCFMSLLRGSQYNRPLNASPTTPPVLHRRQCGKRSFFASEVNITSVRRLDVKYRRRANLCHHSKTRRAVFTVTIHYPHSQLRQAALRRHTMNFQPLRLAHRIPPRDGVSPLPPDFCPGHWTVICGRGKQYFNHGMYRIGSR